MEAHILCVECSQPFLVSMSDLRTEPLDAGNTRCPWCLYDGILAYCKALEHTIEIHNERLLKIEAKMTRKKDRRDGQIRGLSG